MNTDTTINYYNDHSNVINVAEYYEVEHWANQFGISPERLKTAVKAVGVSVEEIANYLKK